LNLGTLSNVAITTTKGFTFNDYFEEVVFFMKLGPIPRGILYLFLAVFIFPLVPLLLFSGPSFIFLPKYNADFASLGLFKQL
jgi:hypothetical protein